MLIASYHRTGVKPHQLVEGDRGGGTPGGKGAGGVGEAREEGAGSGIPKVAQYFAIEIKRKEVRANKNRAGTGIKKYGKVREAGSLNFPVPPHPHNPTGPPVTDRSMNLPFSLT